MAVCDTLNFTRAAERCEVAQPSLTRAIKKLEEEFGGPLFRRERRRTHLTELGRLVRGHFETVLTAADAARADAEGLRNLDKAPLRLGVMCTIGPGRIVGFLEALDRALPALELTLREGPCAELVDELRAGELDLGLISLPAYPDLLEARPLYREHYVITFPPGHRFEAMNAVPIAELRGEAYLQRLNCEFPAHFEALGAPVGLDDLKIKYRSEREDWIQSMVQAGMGCSIMPEHLPILPGIAKRVLIQPEVEREVSLVTVRGRQFTPAVQATVRLAQRHSWN